MIPIISKKYVYGVFHDTIGAWLKAKFSSTSPLTPKTMPYPSNRAHRPSLTFSPGGPVEGNTSKLATAKRVHKIASVQKAHGQAPLAENRLENTAPDTKPNGALAPNKHKTVFFLMPGGYVRPSNACPLGTNKAGPIP